MSNRRSSTTASPIDRKPELSLACLSAAELADLIRTKEVSPVEVVQSTLRRIESVEDQLSAFITLLSESALAKAKEAEVSIMRGNYRGPLHGIPVALKDNIATAGVLTTADSKVLRDWVPKYDATVVRRLNDAGAIVIGKTHLHEFAGGTALSYGPSANPWALDRIPGSSSSGSAVAVASCMCCAALGTDTAGSIRQPASFCGVVGLKPTYGLVSRYGILPLSWSLDHVGPIARSVADVAHVLGAIADHDAADASPSRTDVSHYSDSLEQPPKNVRVGVLTDHFSEPLANPVRKAINTAVDMLRLRRWTVVPVNVRTARYAASVYFAISASEAFAAHESTLKKSYDQYGEDLRRRVLCGMAIPAAEYLHAQRVRVLMCRELDEIFRNVDVLVSPTLPITAPKFGQTEETIDGRSEHLRSLFARFTVLFNLTGNPAMTLPCGFADGLPIGIQLVGRRFDEQTLLRIAFAYEQMAGWHRFRPGL